jgi:hypothetical protein
MNFLVINIDLHKDEKDEGGERIVVNLMYNTFFRDSKDVSKEWIIGRVKSILDNEKL